MAEPTIPDRSPDTDTPTPAPGRSLPRGGTGPSVRQTVETDGSSLQDLFLFTLSNIRGKPPRRPGSRSPRTAGRSPASRAVLPLVRRDPRDPVRKAPRDLGRMPGDPCPVTPAR